MADQESRHTNRLAQETSPYLLQHAHNPVDWFPWGDEALARAKAQDRPIFLSIGYAACHWCHVMERESFEDADTARDLNEGFVAIKVDREERPDLDAIYMDAVQQMAGSGGWPMSVFLTPDGRPFFGGTYFPNQPRHGLPSFRQVLAGVSEAWRDRRDELERSGTQLAHAITAHAAPPAAARLDAAVLDEALAQVERGFDARTGGWGGAPKFPQPMTIEFLLRTTVRSGSAGPLAIARRSLDAMAAGGIHDHLGGGFARYATDSIWLVPHFEKMLYDNALLARAYVHAWQLTGDGRYRAVALDSLTFMERDLLTADGGFAASLDADTAGVEGATYVWTLPEIEALLGDAALSAEFCRAYGVTPEGNFEGHTILSRVADGDEERLRTARATLFAARQKRPQPARDDKVLTAWNGLAIAAFADAAAAFDEPRLAGVASRAANLLLTRVRGADGRLSRSWKDDRALHAGTLEDYTHLADGLLALYQATFDERWFVGARDLADQVLAHFGDPTGGFFDTADDHEALITRPKGLQDNAIPSGSAMAAEVLLRMAAFTGEARYGDAAEQALRATTAYARRYPTAFAQWLSALTLAVGDVVEVAIAGDPGASDAQSLLAVVRAGYRPLAVLAAGSSGSVPLLDDRPQRDGRATAYVCRNFVCRAPVAEPANLAAQLTSAA